MADDAYEGEQQGNADDQVAPPGHAPYGVIILERLLGCGLVEYGQQEAEGKNEIAHG